MTALEKVSVFSGGAERLAARIQANAARREKEAVLRDMAKSGQVAQCRICGRIRPGVTVQERYACPDCLSKERQENHPAVAGRWTENAPAPEVKPAAGDSGSTSAKPALRKPALKL